jgi:hypothetical protein
MPDSSCEWCNRWAEYRCDFRLPADATSVNRMCGRHMCEAHRTRVYAKQAMGHNRRAFTVDYCPEHATEARR